MTEITTRQEERDRIEAGGWTILWGDLINEGDALTFILSIPTATVAAWVEQQIQVQLQKFAQNFNAVSDDVVRQAKEYVRGLLSAQRAGQRDFDGLGVKAGFATYHRKFKTPVFTTKLPDNYQPYVGVRITKPLPPKGAPATTEPSVWDSRSWYKIKCGAKAGMALDVVNDGNQLRDGKIQMAAEGNFSGQHWQLRPSKTVPGAYNLCTMWLGKGMALDVYGDDKTRPHLAVAGNYTGQQWHLTPLANRSWRLTNTYSGSLVLAANGNDGGLHLVDPQTVSGTEVGLQQWALQVVRPITESGFDL